MTEAIEEYIMREDERRAYKQQQLDEQPKLESAHSRAQKGVVVLYDMVGYSLHLADWVVLIVRSYLTTVDPNKGIS